MKHGSKNKTEKEIGKRKRIWNINENMKIGRESDLEI